MIKILFIIGITSALATLVSNNMVYSIMFLALYTLVCGIILIYLGAEFLGYMMIIIYVGAVIILFLFIVMMLDINKEETEESNISYGKHKNVIWGSLTFVFLLNTTFYQIFEKKSSLLKITTQNWEYIVSHYDSIRAFETLYTDNFLYLLVSGSLLLVALTAAIMLTNKNKTKKERESYVKIWQNVNRTITINDDKKNKKANNNKK